jgi:hypothetical protein
MGVWYIKDFDAQTREKAAGSPRLLIVDGHNSHFSMEFLNYAQANEIIVICYPSHTTHVLQGLDVVTFAALKKRWTLARDEWEQANYPVKLTKGPFLKVFGSTFTDTMTPSLIRSSFEKTGVVPFNPAVVRPHQMAPSIAHSTQADLIDMPSPVKRIVRYQNELLKLDQDRESRSPGIHPSQDSRMYDADYDTEHDGRNRNDSPGTPAEMINTPAPPAVHRTTRSQANLLRIAFEGSSADILVSETPISSSFELPTPIFGVPPRIPAIDWNVLDSPTPRRPAARILASENERLRKQLNVCRTELQLADATVQRLNGQLALAGMAQTKARSQLAAQEAKKAAPKRHAISTALGRVLTHSSFIDAVAESAQQREDAAGLRKMKENLEKDWKTFNDEQKAAVAAWKNEKEVLRTAKRTVPKKPLMMTKKAWFAAHATGDGGDIDNIEHIPGEVSDAEEGEDNI